MPKARSPTYAFREWPRPTHRIDLRDPTTAVVSSPIAIAQIPLGSSRHVSTRHVRRVEPVELVMLSVSIRAVRQARHNQNAWARHVKCVVSRRDVTSQVEFGLIRYTGFIRYKNDLNAVLPKFL